MNIKTKGFTLAELLVVIAVISILSSFIFVNVSDSRASARDAQRKSDLRELQSAIELYRLDNGTYPSGCNGYTDSLTPVFSGEPDGAHPCPLGDPEYIIGLAPEYIRKLPNDPFLNGGGGYVYLVNQSGSAYKVMALDTVESELVAQSSDFFRCDPTYRIIQANDGGSFGSQSLNDPGICTRVRTRATGNLNQDLGTPADFGSPYEVCHLASEYENDYALSGGYSTGFSEPKAIEFDTEIVRCK
tara:strand:- start:6073 stop:6804 length:732 start_codon:yes stop_codon:yes gene_type:complete